MMFCPKCGTLNVDDAHFCGMCGNPFTSLPTQSANLATPSQPVGVPPQPPAQVPNLQPNAGYPPPPTQAPYSQSAYQPPPSGNFAPVYVDQSTLAPISGKFFIPLGGAFLAFVSFFLPWLRFDLFGSDVTAYNLAARTGVIGNAYDLLNMFSIPGEGGNPLDQLGWLWLIPICAFSVLILFLRNSLGKKIALGGAILGLLFMLVFTFTLFQMSSDFDSILYTTDISDVLSALGFGYTLAWIGFGVQLAGVEIVWNDVDTRGVVRIMQN